MKNILASFHINLENSFDTIKNRFPLQSLIITLLAGIVLYLVNMEIDSPEWIRIILTCVVAFYFSLGMRIFLETKYSGRFHLLDIVPLLYGILFYITVEPTSDWGFEPFVYFMLHLTGFLSFTFFAPYLLELFHGKVEKIEYTNYFSRVAWTFLMSGIVGLSLLLLGFIAIGSVTALFELGSFFDDGKVYANWATLSFVLIAPLYGLSTLPERKTIDKKFFEVNKFFSFLIRFVAVPFIYVYFFILYAYTAKVLINFSEWPKGMITWMVIGFSIFGYLAYIFSLAYEEENRLVRLFRKYFPIVVIPQIGMLAYAISVRIMQYDLTMNRYFVVVFGLWLLGISVYLILSSRKSLVSITASLAAISLLISVGPWSVYSLPLARQYTRLVTNLETSGLMQNGKILESREKLTPILQNDIYSGIEYVCDFDNCSRLKALFPDQYRKADEESKKNWEENTYEGKGEYNGPSKWELVSAVTTALGISYTYNADNPVKNTYITLSVPNSYDESRIYPIDVSGYEKVLRVYSDTNILNSAPEEYIKANPGSEEFVLITKDTKISYSGKKFIEQLLSKYGAKDSSNVHTEDLTTTLTGSGYEIRIILQNYAIKNPNIDPSYSNNTYYTVSGIALVKKIK